MEESPRHDETVTIIPRRILFVLGAMLITALALKVVALIAPSRETSMMIRGIAIVTEIVRTDTARSRGLAGRIALPNDHGMVFLFPKKQILQFWMKDMLIPIDIIWIDDGRIVGITADIPPPVFGAADDILPRYISPVPVSAVLEVNAGTAERFGWIAGDRVEMK